MLIAVMGGRIVPSFTRNWLVKRGDGQLPATPMGRLDKLALLLLLAALVVWVARPHAPATGLLLLLAGALHLVRLARWAGHRTVAEPLVWVLHAGYSFVPLGALVLGLAILVPDVLEIEAAQHLWMAGAIGLMTLAVMTRATLGHTGQQLTAGALTTSLYLLLILGIIARMGAGMAPSIGHHLHVVAGLCWIGAFAGFAAFYGPQLLTARKDA